MSQCAGTLTSRSKEVKDQCQAISPKLPCSIPYIHGYLRMLEEPNEFFWLQARGAAAPVVRPWLMTQAIKLPGGWCCALWEQRLAVGLALTCRTDDELRRVFTLLRSPRTRHASAYHYIRPKDKFASHEKVRCHLSSCVQGVTVGWRYKPSAHWVVTCLIGALFHSPKLEKHMKLTPAQVPKRPCHPDHASR